MIHGKIENYNYNFLNINLAFESFAKDIKTKALSLDFAINQLEILNSKANKNISKINKIICDGKSEAFVEKESLLDKCSSLSKKINSLIDILKSELAHKGECSTEEKPTPVVEKVEKKELPSLDSYHSTYLNCFSEFIILEEKSKDSSSDSDKIILKLEVECLELKTKIILKELEIQENQKKLERKQRLAIKLLQIKMDSLLEKIIKLNSPISESNGFNQNLPYSDVKKVEQIDFSWARSYTTPYLNFSEEFAMLENKSKDSSYDKIILRLEVECLELKIRIILKKLEIDKRPKKLEEMQQAAIELLETNLNSLLEKTIKLNSPISESDGVNQNLLHSDTSSELNLPNRQFSDSEVTNETSLFTSTSVVSDNTEDYPQEYFNLINKNLKFIWKKLLSEIRNANEDFNDDIISNNKASEFLNSIYGKIELKIKSKPKFFTVKGQTESADLRKRLINIIHEHEALNQACQFYRDTLRENDGFKIFLNEFDIWIVKIKDLLSV